MAADGHEISSGCVYPFTAVHPKLTMIWVEVDLLFCHPKEFYSVIRIAFSNSLVSTLKCWSGWTEQNVSKDGYKGGLMIDEMAIQEDLQLKRTGENYELIMNWSVSLIQWRKLKVLTQSLLIKRTYNFPPMSSSWYSLAIQVSDSPWLIFLVCKLQHLNCI